MIVAVALEALIVTLVAPVSSLVFRASDPAASLPAWLPASLASLGRTSFVMVLMGAGMGFLLFKNVFIAFQLRNQFRFVAVIKQSVSARLLEKYLNAPYSFHLNRNSSQLIRNVVNEVQEFEVRILYPWLMLLSEGLVTTGLLVVLFVVNPGATLAVAGLLGVSSAAYLLVTRNRLVTRGKDRLESDEQRIRLVQQYFGAIKEVKLMGLEASSLRHYQQHNRKSAVAFANHAFFSQIPRLLLEVVAVGSVLLVVLISLARGEPFDRLVSSLAVLAAGAFRLLPSANRLVSVFSSLSFGSVSLQNVSRELQSLEARAPSDVESLAKGPKLAFHREIEVAGVSFTYPLSGQPVLTNLSLKIPRQSFVAIVGESGSGKSTLVDLLLGLLQPDSGKFLVDGVDIRTNLRSWQDKLAYVPQQIYLADLSIRENVAFGVPLDEIDDSMVMKALRLAHLDTFVSNLDEGLDTEVGERGVRLSGGQCQRIGIARALYREPEVIVFDEATSALDDESQAKVMEAIRGLKGSRTIIMISHRLSTIENCDLVFEIVGGSCRSLKQPTVTAK